MMMELFFKLENISTHANRKGMLMIGMAVFEARKGLRMLMIAISSGS